jgi:hypothetical protein
VSAAGREKFEWLRDQVETADDAEGLPEAFTHSNYHPWAAVGEPGSRDRWLGRIRAWSPSARTGLATAHRSGGQQHRQR